VTVLFWFLFLFVFLWLFWFLAGFFAVCHVLLRVLGGFVKNSRFCIVTFGQGKPAFP
jgi:hypothetical protein